jgi:hypothetical protein
MIGRAALLPVSVHAGFIPGFAYGQERRAQKTLYLRIRGVPMMKSISVALAAVLSVASFVGTAQADSWQGGRGHYAHRYYAHGYNGYYGHRSYAYRHAYRPYASRHGYGAYAYRPYRYSGVGAAAALGVATGAVVGGAMVRPGYYYGQPETPACRVHEC